MKDSASKRETELLDLDEEVAAFNADIRQTSSNIDVLQSETSEQPLLSGDVQTIKDQQDQFKVCCIHT